MYLGNIILGSVGFGLLFDQLISEPLAVGQALHDGHSGCIAQASAVLLLIWMAWFAIDDLRRWIGRRRQIDSKAMRIAVEGMTCTRCVSSLEKELRSTDGVASVEVHLRPGEAIVQGEIDEPAIRHAIERCGFHPAELQASRADM